MRITKGLAAVPIGLALVAAGCGGEKTDVTAGTEDFNQELQPQGITMECPKEVKGGENTEFDCTLKGKGGESKTVRLKVVKDGEDLAVDVADRAAYDSAVKQLSGG
jgi:hypothetical protein